MSAAACSNDGDTQRVVAIRPSSTTTEATTTTTAAPAAPAAPRIQRVRSLPGESAAPRAAKPSRRGPTPTGRIIIPRIGLDHLTYEGLDLAIIDYGPSHWPGTAMPGEVGNPVFPGHRVTHSHPFFDIDLIQIGDHVTFVRDNGRFTYEVTQTFVVNADEVWIADATDTPTFTIFGCHPKHSAKQRYVVKGKLIKSERKTAASASGNAGSADDNYTSGNYEPDHPAPPPPESTTTTAPKSLIPRIGGK
ncbi:MAG: sortase [Actinomycetota bacterium]